MRSGGRQKGFRFFDSFINLDKRIARAVVPVGSARAKVVSAQCSEHRYAPLDHYEADLCYGFRNARESASSVLL